MKKNTDLKKSIDTIAKNIVSDTENLPIWDVHHPFNYRVALEASLVRMGMAEKYDGVLHNLRLLRDAFTKSPKNMIDAGKARRSLTDEQEIRYVAFFNSDERGDVLGTLATSLAFGAKSDEMGEALYLCTLALAERVGCDLDVANALLPLLMFSLD